MCLAQTTTTTTIRTLAIYCACAFGICAVCSCFPGVSIAFSTFFIWTIRMSYFSSLCFLHVVYFTENSFHSLFYKIYGPMFGWCLRGNIKVKTKRRAKYFPQWEVVLILKENRLSVCVCLIEEKSTWAKINRLLPLFIFIFTLWNRQKHNVLAEKRAKFFPLWYVFFV